MDYEATRQIGQIRFICHLEPRRRGWGSGLDFKAELPKSQVGEKEQPCGEQTLAGPPETAQHEGSPTSRMQVPLSVTLKSYYAMVTAPFFKQVFLPEFLKAGEE